MTGASQPAFRARPQIGARLVYGPSPPPLDDPAECYHEASKLSPSTITGSAGPMGFAGWGTRLVESERMRPTRRPPGAGIPLPAPLPLEVPLGDSLRARRSRRTFGAGPIGQEALATLLAAAYGVIPGEAAAPGRAVPSGGARYPLELFCVPRLVHGLADALYQYDPWGLALATVDPRPATARLAAAVPHAEIVDGGSVCFVLAATFWRSRAKYGLRSYRFVLLEAGHVAQNLLLAATSLGLHAVPIGGFYDRDLDCLLGLDGVNQGALYLVVVGSPDA